MLICMKYTLQYLEQEVQRSGAFEYPGYAFFLNYISIHLVLCSAYIPTAKKKYDFVTYRGADKSLAQPGRKQATATEDFEFHISYL